nr:MAG TPA: hypothetical protein [Caudoviricetes sp.]
MPLYLLARFLFIYVNSRRLSTCIPQSQSLNRQLIFHTVCFVLFTTPLLTKLDRELIQLDNRPASS